MENKLTTVWTTTTMMIPNTTMIMIIGTMAIKFKSTIAGNDNDDNDNKSRNNYCDNGTNENNNNINNNVNTNDNTNMICRQRLAPDKEALGTALLWGEDLIPQQTPWFCLMGQQCGGRAFPSLALATGVCPHEPSFPVLGWVLAYLF